MIKYYKVTRPFFSLPLSISISTIIPGLFTLINKLAVHNLTRWFAVCSCPHYYYVTIKAASIFRAREITRMQKGQVKLKEVAERTNEKKERELERKTGKKKGVTSRKLSGEKGSEVEKRQPAVTARSNRNSLMKFTLVTVKLAGSLVY